ncbi:GNAT family N-acetyltransferase [Streptomyces sp. NPDC052077]|uniref:GNAT family N-acetyltransferase n=1 Tax=Streptomyces sp. NPDC052077 TaxID=3154757 RepID=UPI003432271D
MPPETGDTPTGRPAAPARTTGPTGLTGVAARGAGATRDPGRAGAGGRARDTGTAPGRAVAPVPGIARWGSVPTPVGVLRLEPVRTGRDLPLLARWMNDPAVAAFWELAGAPEVTGAHLRDQLDGDGHSVPCLGVLDGAPMSYWEVYRADLDPLARYCPVRPYDIGLHLLIGAAADRGRGLGTALIAAVTALVLDRLPDCTRVLAEPDLRNAASVAAFRAAGFRADTEVDLPGKRAALMVRDRVRRL